MSGGQQNTHKQVFKLQLLSVVTCSSVGTTGVEPGMTI